MNFEPGSFEASPAVRRNAMGPIILKGLAILGLAFGVYWPCLRGEFVWDDLLVIQQNPLVNGNLSLGSLWFRTDFPLSTMVFWLEWILWGKSTLGYHLVNVCLHVVNALLFWRVLNVIKCPGAWLGALLFTVHPVCVATVAWITELKNALSLPFYLLSFLWFVQSERPHSERPSEGLGMYFLSLFAFGLALLSKTSTVMLPIVLLLWKWWTDGTVTHRFLVRISPFFGLSLAFGLMTIWFQEHQAITGAQVQTEGLAGRIPAAGKAVWFYLAKALAPVGLNMIYPRWRIDAAAPLAYAPVALLLLALGLLWWFRKGLGRHVLFGLGFFVLNLIPVLGLIDMYYLAISRVSDHFQYLPILGVLALVAAAASRLGKFGESNFAGNPWRAVTGTAMVATLGFLSFERSSIFATDEKLWRDTLAKNPDAWTAHNNLGCILAEKGDLERAIEHFKASLAGNPANARAHANLGQAVAMRGDQANAKTHFETALKIKPDNADLRRQYASVLAGGGQLQEAIDQYREAARLQPKSAGIHQDLADTLRQSHRIKEAVSEYRQAVTLDPKSAEALNNLAWLLATSASEDIRNGGDAVRFAEEACRLTRENNPMMLGTRAAAYAEVKRFADAVSSAEKAARVAEQHGNSRLSAVARQLAAQFGAERPFRE